MTSITEQQNNQVEECKQMCHCEADLTSLTLENEYDLPMINRTLFVPEMMYWQNLAMNYFVPMKNEMPITNEDCMFLTLDGMNCEFQKHIPSLNQLATSFNTEEIQPKSRKTSLDLESECSSIRNSKARSDIRLKNQENRLKNHGLLYESKESYDPKTKRTSRVLVCLHDDCGKEFKKTRNLIIHSRVHTKIRPHVCEF